jgi:hypothetical protein
MFKGYRLGIFEYYKHEIAHGTYGERAQAAAAATAALQAGRYLPVLASCSSLHVMGCKRKAAHAEDMGTWIRKPTCVYRPKHEGQTIKLGA